MKIKMKRLIIKGEGRKELQFRFLKFSRINILQHILAFAITNGFNFPGQPVSWALISPGISPRTMAEGMMEPSISRPSMRLYKYSVYDGKVEMIDELHQIHIPYLRYWTTVSSPCLCPNQIRKQELFGSSSITSPACTVQSPSPQQALTRCTPPWSPRGAPC